MRRRRLLLGLAAALAAVALLAALGAWLLLGTEPGARWLFTRTGAMIAGSLEVEELDGPIRGPLTARGLVYGSDGFEVRIDRLDLDWRLRELLRKRLDIVSLEAEGVTVLLAGRDERDDPEPLPDVHLPVNLIVRSARVRSIEVIRPGEEPIVVDAIDLVTRAVGEVVEIERLTVRSPEISAVAQGRVEPRGDYPVELRLEWSARFPGQPRWAGQGTFGGTLEELRVVHSLASPVAARLEGVLTTPLRDLAFDARLEAPPFALAALGGELPADVTAGGRVSVRGTIEALRAEVDLTAEVPDVGPARVEGVVARDGERFRFERLVVTSPAAPVRIEVAGELHLPEGQPAGQSPGRPPRFDLRASWTDLAWPLAGEPALTSPRGSAQAAGDLAAYDLVADLVVGEPLTAAGLPPVPLELTGRGGESGLAIEEARARLLDGALTARGEVAWAPRVEWDLAITGREIDPSALWPDGGGRLALTARTAGHLGEAGPVGRVAPLAVTGTLRGEPVAARGAVLLDGERVAVSDLDLDWGSLRLAADGRLLPTFDFGFDLEAPNLGLALPGAAGSLTAGGRITGPFEAPRIVATAAAGGFSWNDGAIAELTAEADLDLAPGGTLDLDAEATRAAFGGRAFERVAVDLAGTRAEHRLIITADPGAAAEEGALRLAAGGGLTGEGTAIDGWRGTLETLDLDVPAAGSWRLAAPAAVAASAENVEVGRLCEVSGGARICVEGAWRGEAGWEMSAELTEVPLAIAASFLPPDLEISGAVGGTAEASAGAGGAIAARAELSPGPGEVVYPLPGGGTGVLRFGRGTLEASAGAGGVEAALDLPLPDLGSAAATLELPGYRLAGAPAEEQPIAGTLTAEITDLGFLQAFSEELDDTAGRLDADLTIAGTVGRPRIGGRALLEDGRAAVPALGLRLTEMRLSATGAEVDASEPGPLAIEGSVRSGEGTLTLTGTAPPVPSREQPIRIAVGGRRFLAMDTPEVRLLADPELEVTYDGARLGVTGEVVVPEAVIEIEKAPRSAVAASRDVVYVGGDPRDGPDGLGAGGGLPIAMRVRVVLGEDVEIDVLGLSAEPRGSLLLVEVPGRPTRGTGEIDLAGGTYQAYGQDLTIERGRLIFAGPVDNPRIDLRAFRRADDGVVAGLEAVGTLERPEITLWSEPPMDQSNQLSYLLLGRPLGQAGAGDGDLVANAATSLGIKGGNLLAERIAARFGLEEARIETTGGYEEASLVLGRYLSPRLYVAYGVGLFEAADTLRIRYLLSSRWTLEATTGQAQGADLLYTIERGRGEPRTVPEDEEGLPEAGREPTVAADGS